MLLKILLYNTGTRRDIRKHVILLNNYRFWFLATIGNKLFATANFFFFPPTLQSQASNAAFPDKHHLEIGKCAINIAQFEGNELWIIAAFLKLATRYI